MSNLVHVGPQPRNVKELESSVEKAVIGRTLSCSDQLVKFFDSVLVRGFTSSFEKKM